MQHTLNIREISELTHDVRRIVCEKPDDFTFTEGQATEVAIDKPDWRDEARPFTFTSRNADPDLEFTIKIYPDHDGVTEQIGELVPGDRLIIDEPWGAISYRGPGCFIAGGAGVTPFVAILRERLAKSEMDGNRLIFSNKTEDDIILRDEFEAMEGLDCLFTVTAQPDSKLALGRIDADFLRDRIDDFSQPFYVCGPPTMVEDITDALKSLGANPESVVFEE